MKKCCRLVAVWGNYNVKKKRCRWANQIPKICRILSETQLYRTWKPYSKLSNNPCPDKDTQALGASSSTLHSLKTQEGTSTWTGTEDRGRIHSVIWLSHEQGKLCNFRPQGGEQAWAYKVKEGTQGPKTLMYPFDMESRHGTKGLISKRQTASRTSKGSIGLPKGKCRVETDFLVPRNIETRLIKCSTWAHPGAQGNLTQHTIAFLI